jgi:hypothetical protein
MIENPDRVEQFTDEIAEMRLPDSRSSTDRLLLRGGVGLMVLGIVIAIAAYFIGHGTSNALQQRDAIVIAVIGLAVTLVGAALFVRYSMAQFLRFWLARNAWEQAAQTDRLVDAIRSEN